MIGAEQSLLSFMDAPVVVGDPDGAAVYVNPAFEARFEMIIHLISSVNFHLALSRANHR